MGHSGLSPDSGPVPLGQREVFRMGHEGHCPLQQRLLAPSLFLLEELGSELTQCYPEAFRNQAEGPQATDLLS